MLLARKIIDQTVDVPLIWNAHCDNVYSSPPAIFLLRKSDFVKDVPEGEKVVFIDSNPIAPFKLDILKKMIKDRFKVRLIIFSYVEIGRPRLKSPFVWYTDPLFLAKPNLKNIFLDKFVAWRSIFSWNCMRVDYVTYYIILQLWTHYNKDWIYFF